MFDLTAFENSRPDGFSVLEVVDDLPGTEGRPRRFVPLRRTELAGEVAGPLASLRLIQTYGYSKAECDKTLEAVYRFPLPGDAAVTSVRVRFGEVEIQAELRERQAAEAEYEQAKQMGQQAALATREAPDVFTLQVAGLQPDQAVTVETSYVQLARVEGLDWSLRVPLTTAPRYVRGDEFGSRHAGGQPLLLLRDPGHRFALNLTLQGTGAVSSPTHRLTVTPREDGLQVSLAEGEVVPDRDCVLSWRPPQEEDRPALRVMLHEDPAAGQAYFMALVAPPARQNGASVVPREVILLVDHSGSMQGAKWEAADWAVKRFLSGLTSRDTFALGLFHHDTRWYMDTPVRADPEAVGAAIRFLEGSRDSGGTELGVALEQALGLARSPSERARHVLILTDAQVSDEGRILRLADEESRRDGRRRISVLCIDAAPNAFLAGELAERGGGTARFLTSAEEQEDITTALDAVLEEWSAPVLAGLRLELSRPGAEAAGRELRPAGLAGWSAIDLGDLPAGRAVWAAGRFVNESVGETEFRVTTSDGTAVASRRAHTTGGEHQRLALKALFGARRVLGLEFLIHSGYSGEQLRDALRRLGYDPDQVIAVPAGPKPKVYAENVRQEADRALRELLVREALEYGLACSETAFVARRLEAGKPVEGTVAVANALPSGWSEEFAMPMPVSKRVDMRTLFAGEATQLRTTARRLYSPSPDVGADLASYSADPAFLAESAPAAASIPAPAATVFSEPAAAQREGGASLFIGVPVFENGVAVLFDTARDGDAERLREPMTFTRLELRFPGGQSQPGSIDADLRLMLYVDDLASPRAQVRVKDLVAQGGSRPLNVRRRAGEVVRIVLVDSAGAWARGAPRIEVLLHG